MNQNFSLDYGFDELWLIRWKDNNCDRNWRSFFTSNIDDSDKVMEQHCNHEGFEIRIVKLKVPDLTVEGN